MSEEKGQLWSREAEISVLGAMLLDEEACRDALGRLDPEDFYRKANRTIFAAFQRLQERGEATGDVVVLSEELKASGHLEAVGGMAYLAQLIDAVSSTATFDGHARVVRQHRVLRDLQAAARETIEGAETAGPGQALDVLAEALEKIRTVQDRTVDPDRRRLRTAREILDDPDARRTVVTVAEKLAWAGHVTLFAGREKSGKSTLLRWAIARVSRGEPVWGGPPVGDGLDVLYYGQEPPVDVADDLDRMGADLGRVHVADMRTFGDRFGHLERDVEDVDPDFVVVDTLSTLTALLDLDPGSSADWEPVMDRLGALASESGAAFGVNHHARKSDGEYRDSTAIGAGVDCILEMRPDPSEGETVRTVTARARSSVPATGFKYALRQSDARPRLELLDGSLSLEERVQRFVQEHEGCSQRDVLNGVRGGRDDVRAALKNLSQDGGPLIEEDTSTPYQYRIAENPQGNGVGTAAERERNGGTGNGGGSVPSEGLSPVRERPGEERTLSPWTTKHRPIPTTSSRWKRTSPTPRGEPRERRTAPRTGPKREDGGGWAEPRPACP